MASEVGFLFKTELAWGKNKGQSQVNAVPLAKKKKLACTTLFVIGTPKSHLHWK